MSEEVGAKRWYAVHTYSEYENKVKKFRKKSRIYEYDRTDFQSCHTRRGRNTS